MTDVLETLELIGSGQWGIVTTAQAEREGISRLKVSRLAERGTIQRARRGVYFLPSVDYAPATEVRAAWIGLEPKLFANERWEGGTAIVVSHESAASLHSIGNIIPDQHSFTAVKRKQTAQDGITIYCNRELPPSDVVNLDGLPVTSIERTIADLAANGIERNYLADIVADALTKEGVRIKSLEARLDPWAKAYGVSTGEELVRAFREEASSREENDELVERTGDAVVGSFHLGRVMAHLEIAMGHNLEGFNLPSISESLIARSLNQSGIAEIMNSVASQLARQLDVQHTVRPSLALNSAALNVVDTYHQKMAKTIADILSQSVVSGKRVTLRESDNPALKDATSDQEKSDEETCHDSRTD